MKNILNFAAIGLAHTHIYGMCSGLISAGANLKYVYDEDITLAQEFVKNFSNAQICNSIEEILNDESITLIASADIPSNRAYLAIECMNAGKDFFVDKVPFIKSSDYENIKATINKTGRKYFVFYSESVADESIFYALKLIKNGKIGDVFHIEGIAPHRLNPDIRPDWVFKKKHTGGIITDLGCQQIHQFLKICNGTNVTIDSARVRNYNNPSHTGFDDFGDFTLSAENGITGYFRVDWSIPNGLGTWGDIRLIIEGSKGYIELRKNCNLGFDNQPNHVFIVTADGTEHKVLPSGYGITLFDDIISDCLNRTDTAPEMNIDLMAAYLAIKTQNLAEEWEKIL